MSATEHAPEVFRERRRRLAAKLDGAPALVVAGLPRARNYPANRHPFRAESHFLYLVGRPIAGAALFVEGARATLFVEPPSAEDALWHGPSPTLAELEATLGVETRPLATLGELGAARLAEAATLAPNDAATAAAASRWLGRGVPLAGDLPWDARPKRDAALADAMIALRLVHDAAAIDELRAAAEATTAAHLAGMAATRVGVTEAAVRAAMEAAIATRGLVTAYGSIVTTHGEVLHDETHERTLEAGDLLLADVGAESRGGFAGDVTRTWPVRGAFSASQRAIYEVVLEAQRRAIARVRPGVRYRAVHEEAALALVEGLVALGILRGDADSLAADGAHALFFPHGVGHLLGLDVHDMEDLGDRAGYAPGRARSARFGDRNLRLDRDLEAGMAVTIEPGFYVVPAILEGDAVDARLKAAVDRAALARHADVRGVRIEDDVLVTPEGHEVLTRFVPKAADDVERAVSRR